MEENLEKGFKTKGNFSVTSIDNVRPVRGLQRTDGIIFFLFNVSTVDIFILQREGVRRFSVEVKRRELNCVI